MAKDWRRPNEAARKHWKQREAGQTSTASRGLKRLIFTVLSLALLGLLIWYIIPRQQTVYLAYLAEDYGPTIRNPAKVEVAMLPPALASSSGVYQQLFAPLGKRIFEHAFTVADVAEGGNSKLAAQKLVDTLTVPLKDKWDLGEVEFLVLYVSAHGVAIDGEPYLMWNEDYAAELMRKGDGQSKPALMKFDDLLEQIRGLRAQQKLLVLDSGQLYADPRLGIFVNEFPRLAEQRVAATDDRSLWMLTSHGAMEHAHVFRSDRTSVFGHAVTKGMAGASLDPENRDDLSLASFVSYVESQVQDIVSSRTGALQTPRFVNGRQGVLKVSEIPNVTFLKHTFFDQSVPVASLATGTGTTLASSGSVPISAAMATLVLAQAPSGNGTSPATAPAPQPPAGGTAPTVPPATQQAAPATAPADGKPADPAAAANPATPAPSTPETAAPVPPATATPATTPPGQPAATPPADAAEPTKSVPIDPIDFALVWKEVKAIEDPNESPTGWSPVDYAPHLWAQLHQQLSWFETQYQLEGDVRKENSKFIREEILKPLAELAAASQGTKADGATKTSLQIFERLMRARANFLASKAFASASDRSRESVKAFVSAVRLKNYLTYRVAQRVRDYGYQPDTVGQYDTLVAAMNVLANVTFELEDASQATLVEADWTNSAKPLSDLRDLRRSLDELDRLLPPTNMAATVPAEAPAVIAKAKSTDIRDQQPAKWVDLHVRLAALSARSDTAAGVKEVQVVAAAGAADPDFAKNVEWIRDLARGQQPRVDEEAIWKAYRGVGRQLRAFSEFLKADLKPGIDVVMEDLKLCAVERRLRLVDGRDVPGLSVGDVIAMRQLCPSVAPRVEIQLAEGKIGVAPYGAGKASQKSVKANYRWSGPEGADAILTVNYLNEGPAKGIITLVNRQMGDPIPFKLKSDGSLPEIVLQQSRERQNSTNTEPVTLVLTVKVENEQGVEPASAYVDVEAHGSEIVTLVAYRVKDGVDVPIASSQLAGSDDEFNRELAQAGTRDGNFKAKFFQTLVRPFPNRADQYRFKLTNLSGASGTRDVLVDIYEPLVAPDDRVTANWMNAGGELDRNQFKKVDQFHREISLASNTPVTFPFTEKPKPAAEGAMPPAAAPPVAPPAEEKKEAGPPQPVADFRYGLVFEVRDKAQPELRWYHWIDFRAREPNRYVRTEVRYDGHEKVLDIKVLPLEGATQPPDGFSAKWSVENAVVAENLARTMEVDRKPREQVSLGVTGWRPRMPKEEEPQIWLFVDVDGYPRAFAVPFQDNRGQRPMELDKAFQRAKIVDPPHDWFAYKKGKEPGVRVPVGIQIDGREGDVARVVFGDGNQGKQPELTLFRAQHVFLHEKGWDKDNVLTLSTTIGDYVGADAIAFDTTKTESPIPVEVELKSGTATRSFDRARIVVDDIPPELKIQEISPLQAFATKDLSLTVKASVNDPAGVKIVKFLVLAAGRPEPSDKEMEKPDFVWEPKPQPNPAGTGNLPAIVTEPKVISVTTPFSRGPGRWAVWAVAVNQVDNQTKPVQATDVFIVEQEPEKPPPGTGGNVIITGMTHRAGTPTENIQVELVPLKEGVGEPQSAVSTDPNILDGRPEAIYKFENVVPGEYKIVASGQAKSSRPIFGGVDKIVVTDKDKGTKKFDIKMDFK